LVFREFSLGVRLLTNILGGAPHPRSESGIHRVSFLTGYSFSEESVLPKMQVVCQEETQGPGKNPVAEYRFFFVPNVETPKTLH
jgi:hypothetical protein